jgi:hypothetical protein
LVWQKVLPRQPKPGGLVADIEGPPQLPLENPDEASGEIGFLRPAHMTITVPVEDVRHTITPEQLDAICRGGKDASFEWCLGLLGLAGGLLQNLLSVVKVLIRGGTHNETDVVLAMMCVGCLAAAAAKYSEHKKARADVDRLREKVVAGKRVLVK